MADKEANTNYGFSDIHRYLNGQMTAKEMHDIERAALQDPFLADAIEGYENRDKQQSEKHLNEITARIGGSRQEAKIIAVSKHKRYGWLAAASVLFLLGISVFIFYQNKNYNQLTAVTSNEVKRGKTKDAPGNESNKLSAPQQDSVSALMQDEIIAAKPKEERKETAFLKKKEREPNVIASTSLPKKEDSLLAAAAPAASLTYRSKMATAQPSLQATMDTLHNDSMNETVATGLTTRAISSSPKSSWTTDKGKPFVLSEVQVVNMGKTNKKAADTSAIKPEGGWPHFQDYLFGKLSKKDSSLIANRWNNMGNLELEFSVSETGSPYDVHVLHAPDSIMANKVVSAIENGPKWISSDKKEKRLNIKY